MIPVQNIKRSRYLRKAGTKTKKDFRHFSQYGDFPLLPSPPLASPEKMQFKQSIKNCQTIVICNKKILKRVIKENS